MDWCFELAPRQHSRSAAVRHASLAGFRVMTSPHFFLSGLGWAISLLNLAKSNSL